MGKETDIEWCDSTLNLQMGCDGCELWTAKVRNCYAGQLTERYAGHNAGFPKAFNEPVIYPDRLAPALAWKDLTGTKRPDKPWLDGLPRMIFLNDMGDTFTESLPLDWLAPFLPQMAGSPHQYMLLTKRGERLRQFSELHPLPPNVWPGVSVTSQANIGRLASLLKVCGGGPKWASFEPLLGQVEFLSTLIETKYEWCERIPPPVLLRMASRGEEPEFPWLELAIFGGESGKEARPTDILHLRYGVQQCRDGGIAPFVKQMGSNFIGHEYDQHSGEIIGDFRWELEDPKGGEPREWPVDLRVREFPSTEGRP